MKHKFVIIITISIFVIITLADIVLHTKLLDNTVVVIFMSAVCIPFGYSIFSMFRDYYRILKRKKK